MGSTPLQCTLSTQQIDTTCACSWMSMHASQLYLSTREKGVNPATIEASGACLRCGMHACLYMCVCVTACVCSRVMISCPTAHCNHMIKVLEQRCLTDDYAIKIHTRLYHSNTNRACECSSAQSERLRTHVACMYSLP